MKKRVDVNTQIAYSKNNRKGVKMKIRPIVKAAFKVDELVHQFMCIDVDDGLLSFKNNEADVNEKYSDEYIIGEAENRLDIAMDEYNQEE